MLSDCERATPNGTGVISVMFTRRVGSCVKQTLAPQSAMGLRSDLAGWEVAHSLMVIPKIVMGIVWCGEVGSASSNNVKAVSSVIVNGHVGGSRPSICRVSSSSLGADMSEEGRSKHGIGDEQGRVVWDALHATKDEKWE